jgi:hypothetical protein
MKLEMEKEELVGFIREEKILPYGANVFLLSQIQNSSIILKRIEQSTKEKSFLLEQRQVQAQLEPVPRITTILIFHIRSVVFENYM